MDRHTGIQRNIQASRGTDRRADGQADGRQAGRHKFKSEVGTCLGLWYSKSCKVAVVTCEVVSFIIERDVTGRRTVVGEPGNQLNGIDAKRTCNSPLPRYDLGLVRTADLARTASISQPARKDLHRNLLGNVPTELNSTYSALHFPISKKHYLYAYDLCRD
jgi:hypothetical protein